MKYLPRFIQIVLTVLWEQVAAFLAGPLTIILYKVGVRLPDPSTHGEPIVIVPGLSNTGLSFWLLQKRLVRQGFSVHVVPLGTNFGDARQGSEKLKDYMTAHKLENVTMLGFSLGALIGLWYLQYLGGWPQVKFFISVAGPFQGAPLARVMAWSSTAFKQLVPGSKYLRELHRQPIEFPERMVCISNRFDGKVPRWSTELSGVRHELADTLGHTHTIVLSRRTVELILKYARSPESN